MASVLKTSTQFLPEKFGWRGWVGYYCQSTYRLKDYNRILENWRVTSSNFYWKLRCWRCRQLTDWGHLLETGCFRRIRIIPWTRKQTRCHCWRTGTWPWYFLVTGCEPSALRLWISVDTIWRRHSVTVLWKWRWPRSTSAKGVLTGLQVKGQGDSIQQQTFLS